MKLKIMEYNILNGLCREENEKYIHESAREKAAISAVKSIDPDILILCEASFTPAHKTKEKYSIIQDYAKIFGFRYFFYGIKNKRDGSTILSKYPLKGENFSLEKMSFIRVSFCIAGKEITLDVVHPHPKIPENYKMIFIKSVMRDKKYPYILAGDFNALSPKDEYNRSRLIKGFRLFRPEDAEEAVDDAFKREMVSYILSQGMIDSYKKINKKTEFSIPSSLFKDNQDASMRLDYIFCSKDFKVLEAGIIKNEFTEVASDHYPIYTVLELK